MNPPPPAYVADEVTRRELRSASWRRRLPGGEAEDLDGTEGGGGSAFETELLEDVAEGLLHGLLAVAQDAGNVGVGLALGHPKQGLGLANREAEGIDEWRMGRKVGSEPDFGQGTTGLFDIDALPFEPGFDGFEQVGAADGLHEVVIGAEIHAGSDTWLVTPRGEEDERGRSGCRVMTDGDEDPEAICVGQPDVAEDEIGKFVAGDADTLGGCGGLEDGVALHAENG